LEGKEKRGEIVIAALTIFLYTIYYIIRKFTSHEALLPIIRCGLKFTGHQQFIWLQKLVVANDRDFVANNLYHKQQQEEFHLPNFRQLIPFKDLLYI